MSNYFLLRGLITFSLAALASPEFPIKSKIVSLINSYNSTTKSSKLCKLQTNLAQMLEGATKANRKELLGAIDYLAAQLHDNDIDCGTLLKDRKNINAATIRNTNKMESFEIRNSTIPSNQFYKSDIRKNASLEMNSDTYMLYDDKAVEMDDYLETLGSEGSFNQILCENCQMDYDDEKVADFNEGMSSDKDSTGDGGTNKIVVFFSCVGIGLVILIVAVTVAAYFGIKKLKKYLNNRSISSVSSSRMNGRSEMYEMT